MFIKVESMWLENKIINLLNKAKLIKSFHDILTRFIHIKLNIYPFIQKITYYIIIVH